ncbi:MAG TPA: hypothetical protein VHY22_02650 [Chthoniobacteraceae bacterium]|jgi:hypothetical protein|nr:hypothetical protein [Chthoniobacteraceae bacterium]
MATWKPGNKPRQIIVNKLDVAISQLETAMLLWFHDGDPVSIHALTVSSHDCMNALVEHHTKNSSMLQSWMKTQSRNFQDKIRSAQNFFKHGKKDLKAKYSLVPTFTDMVMMDAVISFEKLPEVSPRAVMRAFTTRFFLEYPHLLREDARKRFEETLEAQQLSRISRKEYWEAEFPKFLARFPK